MSTAVQEPPVARQPLVRKTLWSGAASLLGVAGGLVCSVLVARLLGVEGTGRVASLLWLTEVGCLVATLGLGHGLTRFVAELDGAGRGDEAEALGRWMFRRYAALAAAGIALVVLAGPLLLSGAQTPALWLAAAALYFVRTLETPYRSWLAGRQRFDRLLRLNLAASALRVAGVALSAWQFGVAGALWGYLAGAALPALLAVRRLGGAGARPAAALRQRAWRFSLEAWVATALSAFVWTRMEIFFLERFRDASEVALFTVGLTLAGLATAGPLLLGGALVPHFAERKGARDLDNVRKVYRSATRLMALVIFPLCFGTAAIAPVLLPALFGAEFAPAVPNAIVLVATASLAYATVGSALLHGMERSRFMAVTGVAGAILAILVFSTLVPAHGAWGAVWGRAALQTFFVLWGHVYIARRLDCPVPGVAVARTAAAALACAAVAYLLAPAAGLVVAILAGAVTYVVALRLVRAVQAEDLPWLTRLVEPLPPRARRPFERLIGWVR